MSHVGSSPAALDESEVEAFAPLQKIIEVTQADDREPLRDRPQEIVPAVLAPQAERGKLGQSTCAAGASLLEAGGAEDAPALNPDAEIEVKLLNLAGEELMNLHSPLSASILHLRRRVWQQCGIVPFAMQIVHPTQGVLSDESLLQDFVTLPIRSLSLLLVRQHSKPELDAALLKHIAHNDVEAVKQALRAFTDPNCESIVMSPLVYASQAGLTDIVCTLCAAGADVDRASGAPQKTPLLSALSNRHTDAVRSLCDARARLNISDHGMIGPLCLAAQLGSVDAVRLLCEAKADKNESLQDHSTPLLIASQRGHVDMVDLLCQEGADLEKSRDDGATPLLIAASHGHAAHKAAFPIRLHWFPCAWFLRFHLAV